MLARPPVPALPISAALASARDKRRSSITSFGLPYERGIETLSPFADRYEYGSQGSSRGGASEAGDSVYGGIDGRR
jgi:hypothetical protein